VNVIQELHNLGINHAKLLALFKELREGAHRLTQPQQHSGPVLIDANVGELASKAPYFDVTYAGSSIRFAYSFEQPKDARITCSLINPSDEEDAPVLGVYSFDLNGQVKAATGDSVGEISSGKTANCFASLLLTTLTSKPQG
jgi:hypothetical protein